jgi:biopolymer transport protein ExbD
MRRSGKSRGVTSRGGGHEEPIEPDMTPMMNMLIILISFLVTMVVFTQLAVIKFNLPPAQGGAGEAAKAPADSADPSEKGPDVDITVVITENGFQIIGEGRKLDPIPRGAKGFDYGVLGAFMKKLKEEYPSSENVVLLIDSNIVYQDIITSMDVMREQKFPNILLSGGVYQ